MAYDFGSQTLGIKNPFKTEGALRTLGGVLTLLLAVYVVFTVPDLVFVDLNAPRITTTHIRSD